MKTLEEYEELIRQWGEDKGIYAQSTWQKQLEKWGSERAELLYAETHKKRMDAFGDQYVCLVHVRNMYTGVTRLVTSYYGELTSLDRQIMNMNFRGAQTTLISEMKHSGYHPLECIDMAVTTILNRTGKMVNGIFEKDA
jgi:hypothetical protein